VPVHGDIVHLNTGMQIEGKIVAETDAQVRVRRAFGQSHTDTTCAKDDILFIEKTQLGEESLTAHDWGYELGLDHYEVGLLASQAGDHEAAVRELRRAVEIDPYDARAHLCLALEYDKAGKQDAAVVEASRAIRLNGLIKAWALFRQRFGGLLYDAATDYLSDYIQPMESGNNLLASARQDQYGLERDKSPEQNPITIGGKIFRRGLGTHANSEIVFNIVGRGYHLFRSWIGPDDEARNPNNPMEPSVVFEVYTDGDLAFRSPVLTAGSAGFVNVPVSGVRKLKLVVRDAGNGASFDHADWAEAGLVTQWLRPPETVDKEIAQMDTATIRAYRQRLVAEPHDPNVRNELGIVYLRSGKLDEALAEFNTALKSDPSFAPAYTNTALAYARGYRFEDAKPFWQKRAQIRRDNKWDGIAAQEAQATLVAPELLLKMPEVYTRKGSLGDILLYRRLVSKLPADAQRWVLGTGQFMEDLRLDDEERQLLGSLASVKDPLIYLTSPRIMDGVGGYDLEWARRWSPQPGNYYYLDADFDQLENDGLVPAAVRPVLNALISKSKNDFELRSGLYLIANFGHAPKHLFQWRAGPSYNTQLLVLSKLLERGIPKGEERLAVAAALDYGAILTIANTRIWPNILEHLYGRLRFVTETTPLVQAQGADWDPKGYSLVADIALLWPGGCMSANPLVRTVPLEDFCRDKPMDLAGFNTNVASIKTLREMRDAFLKQGFSKHRSKLAASVANNPCLQGHYGKPIDIAADFAQHHLAMPDAKESYPTEWPRWDVNWQWQHVKSTGQIAGWCTEWGLVCAMFTRSLNIAPLEKPHSNWYYHPSDNTWKLDAWDQAQYCKNKDHPQHPSFWKFPWHNFHLLQESEVEAGAPKEYDPAQNIFVIMRDKSMLPEKGIPAGYALRRITRIK
jgi:tetratricopeptide (TPR) repeat protein